MKLIDYIGDSDFVAAGKNIGELDSLVQRVRHKRNAFRWFFGVGFIIVLAGALFLLFKANPIIEAMTSVTEPDKRSALTAPPDLDGWIRYSQSYFRIILPIAGTMTLIGLISATGFSATLRNLLIFQSYLHQNPTPEIEVQSS